MRKALYGAVLVLALLVLALVVAPSFVDWGRFKPYVSARIRLVTGREVRIAGSLSVWLLPSPSLVADDVRIAAPAGTTAADLVRIRTLRLRLALLPLLSGRIRAESVTLEAPVITLETLADGRFNWRLHRDQGRHPTARPPRDTVRLDKIEVKDGVIVYRDTRRGARYRIEAIAADIRAESLSGAYRGRGRAALNGTAFDFAFDLGRAGADDRVPATLSLSLPGARMRGGINGEIAGDATGFRGQLQFEAADIARLWKTLPAPARAAARLLAPSGSLTAKGRLSATTKGVRLADLEIETGDNRMVGALAATYGVRGKPVSVGATLKLTRLDVDSWLAKRRADRPKPGARGVSSNAAAGARQAPSFPAWRGGDVRLRLDLGIDAIIYNRSVVRETRIVAGLADGRLTLTRAVALLPGGAEISLLGGLDLNAPDPTFDGRLRATADNLRGVLDWLRVDVSAVPSDRLRRFSLSGKLRGDPRAVRLSGIEMELDVARFRGTIAATLGARPSLSLDVETERFDLDAYLARPPKVVAVTKGAGGEAPKRGPARGVVPMLGVPLPTAFDARVTARIGRLIVHGETLRGLRLDGALEDGTLRLRALRFADMAGASVRVRGRVEGVAGGGAIAAAWRIEADRARALWRLAGVSPPSERRLNQPVRLSGTLGRKRAKGAWSLDARAWLGGTEAWVKGSGVLTWEGRRPHVTADLRTSEIDLAAVLGLLARPAGEGKEADVAGVGITGMPPPRPSRGRWSRTPMDFSALARADGVVSLRPASLVLGDYRIAAPALRATLKDGVLSVDRLAGGLLGGRLEASGRLDTATSPGRPSLTLRLRLRDVSLEASATETDAVRLKTGKLGLDLTLDATGDNLRALIASARGRGRLVGEGGAITGFDLAEVNRRLGAAAGSAGLVGVLFQSLSRGVTRYARFDGPLSIDKGVIATSGLRLAADGGKGVIDGRVDLIGWTVAGQARFRFAALAGAPPLIMRMTGSLSAPNTTLDVKALQAWLKDRKRKTGAAP